MTETSASQSETNVFQRLVSVLKDVFSPILPAITAAGLLQGIVMLLMVTGIVQEDSSTYSVLSVISDAVFYFLPILLATSAAKVFDVNRYIAISVALILVHPDLVSLFESDQQTTVFGLPIFENDYSSSVIPIFLIVWSQKYVEKFARKIIPEIVESIFVPTLTLLITALLALLVFGPLGMSVGILLGNILQWVGSIAHWLVPFLLGGFGLFAVMTGAHYALFPLMFNQLNSQGYEDFFAAGMIATNIGLAGAILGVILKSKNKEFRQYSFSAFITALLGISQPGLYGVALQFRRAFIGAMLGGFAGGLFGGVSNFVAYAYVNPGLAALPVYISPDGSWGNLIKGLIIMVIAFVVAFVYVYAGDVDDISDENVNKMMDERDTSYNETDQEENEEMSDTYNSSEADPA